MGKDLEAHAEKGNERTERKLLLTRLGNGLLPIADFALAGAAPRRALGREGSGQHLDDIAAPAKGDLEAGDSPGRRFIFLALSPAAPRPGLPASRLPRGEPPSLAARARQGAPSIFRKTPPFFPALERLQASASRELQACQ